MKCLALFISVALILSACHSSVPTEDNSGGRGGNNNNRSNRTPAFEGGRRIDSDSFSISIKSDWEYEWEESDAEEYSEILKITPSVPCENTMLGIAVLPMAEILSSLLEDLELPANAGWQEILYQLSAEDEDAFEMINMMTEHYAEYYQPAELNGISALQIVIPENNYEDMVFVIYLLTDTDGNAYMIQATAEAEHADDLHAILATFEIKRTASDADEQALIMAVMIPIFMNYMTNSNIASADSSAKNIFVTVAATIAMMESRGDPLPTSDLTVSADENGWTVTGTPAFAVQTIRERLNADLPYLIGNGTVFIQNGAPVAIIWDANSTGASMAAWSASRNEWLTPVPVRNRQNIYGAYPDVRW
jgi:hypothetical protein